MRNRIKVRLVEEICVFYKDWVEWLLIRKSYFISKLGFISLAFRKSATAQNRRPHPSLNHISTLLFSDPHVYPPRYQKLSQSSPLTAAERHHGHSGDFWTLSVSNKKKLEVEAPLFCSERLHILGQAGSGTPPRKELKGRCITRKESRGREIRVQEGIHVAYPLKTKGHHVKI